jgi:hypothetical protein
MFLNYEFRMLENPFKLERWRGPLVSRHSASDRVPVAPTHSPITALAARAGRRGHRARLRFRVEPG